MKPCILALCILCAATAMVAADPLDKLVTHEQALTKRIKGDRIIWEGTMRNTDGRELPMSFSRKR